MNPTQSNTQQGNFPAKAGEDLTGKEAYLAVLSNNSGTPQITLPAAITDLAFYQIHDGGPSGSRVSVQPLAGGMAVRVPLKGTCDPGDSLSLAAAGTAADKGKVRKVPSANGTYRPLLIAEEAGVDGQLVLARVSIREPIVISG